MAIIQKEPNELQIEEKERQRKLEEEERKRKQEFEEKQRLIQREQEEQRKKKEAETKQKLEIELKTRKVSKPEKDNSLLPKSSSKMFEIGVGDSSSPSGMPIRGSRDSGLDFDDVLYREAMSEMDNADDYISRDYHTDYSGRSPSIADTIEDSVSMPRKGGVQNQFIEDSRSSDQTTVIEEDKPEPDQWCVPKTTSISYTIPLSIKFVLQALHFFFLYTL